MKLSDYVIKYLEEKNTEHMFFVAGGGCMHLLDSLHNSDYIEGINLLHEQSVAIATESYAFTKGATGVALVTTGPGGTNAVTGVLSAYLDSIPCLFISGQVKTTDLKKNYGVRSHGSQEADIVNIVKDITKYSIMITDKQMIKYHLEKAWHEATSGRKGPVWLDIPLDIQGSDINPDELIGYRPDLIAKSDHLCESKKIIDLIHESKRPVIIAGNGLRGYEKSFYSLIEKLKIPIIPSWKAVDLLHNDHELYVGRCGTLGERAANFAMQTSDLVISLGCKLDFSVIGHDRSKWAPLAKKIIVDIDETEISKLNIDITLPLVCDVCDLLEALNDNIDTVPDFSKWTDKISSWKKKYPIITPPNSKNEYNQDKISTYQLIETLFKNLPDNTTIVPASAGTVAEICYQAMVIKKGQKVRSNHGLGSMGYELPSAIGAYYATGKTVITVAGDGGIQLNIQELAIISGRDLPIKIFIVNNNGYASIRNMQTNHFNSRFIGNSPESGLYIPKMDKLAKAYGIEGCNVDKLEQLEPAIKTAINTNKAFLCNVSIDPFSIVSPRTTSKVLADGKIISTPLEDLFPFLPEEQLKAELDISNIK